MNPNQLRPRNRIKNLLDFGIGRSPESNYPQIIQETLREVDERKWAKTDELKATQIGTDILYGKKDRPRGYYPTIRTCDVYN